MSIRPFLDLQPPASLFIVHVTAVHADGTSTVQFPNGSQFVALGTLVGAGNNAFVRGRQVIGEAPAVTPITLEIPVAPPLPNYLLCPSGALLLTPSGAPLLYS